MTHGYFTRETLKELLNSETDWAIDYLTSLEREIANLSRQRDEAIEHLSEIVSQALPNDGSDMIEHVEEAIEILMRVE